jgi:transposase
MQLRARLPRYRCTNTACDREVFCHDSDRLARPGRTTTRRCANYVLRRLIVDRATVAAVARELGRSWDTVNGIAVEATTNLLVTDTTRLDGVRVIGVDEHRWAHTRHAAGDGYVTVIVDLTPVVDGTGRARLLDLVAGRSAAALTSWLADREKPFRDRVEVVAMDGFGGYKNAATSALPDAVTVMDPFHVVALAGTKLDLCRQRVQQDTCGHRGRSGDPLYRVRRTLRTRTELLTSKQTARLEAVFAADEHVAVEVTWRVYQQIIAAYGHPDPRQGRTLLARVIDILRAGVPAGLEELATLGRTLHRRRDDVLAYFAHRASNGPTEAINGRLEALRRNALGFRNLINYRIRSLLHCGKLAL